MMAGRVYSKRSSPIRKSTPKVIVSTTVTGRRVKRRLAARPTNGSKPPSAVTSMKTAKLRKATVASKPAKPLTAPKKKTVINPKSTAKRRAIPPAARVKHRVTSTREKSVAFSLSAPTGVDVSITGTFNDWVPQQMTKGPDGLWHITLQLMPGRHQYRFVVDTVRWQDPNNPRKIANEHGSFNSVCEVM